MLVALEVNAGTGDPFPVQVHTGFGDADLSLPLARPGLLKPLIERYDTTPFVLLHCYPFVREAGWLAHVYANVFFDLSLTIPHVAQPEQALREALELAPLSKLLYASDAARTPELYFLGATWWRDALAVVLPELGEGEAAARMILRENALTLYRIGVGRQAAQGEAGEQRDGDRARGAEDDVAALDVDADRGRRHPAQRPRRGGDREPRRAAQQQRLARRRRSRPRSARRAPGRRSRSPRA